MTETGENGGKWWISDGRVEDGAEKILGPFESKALALRVRALYEDHAAARGLTYWVSQEPATVVAAVPDAPVVDERWNVAVDWLLNVVDPNDFGAPFWAFYEGIITEAELRAESVSVEEIERRRGADWWARA